MAKKRPLVIVTRKLPEVIETRMMELFDTRLNDDDASMTQAELIEAAQTADVLVPTVTDRIDKGVLAQANPDLRLIANFGTGVDNIDLASANSRVLNREPVCASLPPVDGPVDSHRFRRRAPDR